jgi:Trypsin-like peptidase domain
MALNNLGKRYSELGRREEAKIFQQEAQWIERNLAMSNPFDLNESRQIQQIREGKKRRVTPSTLTFLPKGDPDTSLKRSVLKLTPMFAGETNESPQFGTAFVVKRQGHRAWIVTARHVLFAKDDYRPAVKLEAEIYAGTLPDDLLPPRLEVVMPDAQGSAEGDDLIILEVRGMPEDVQPLPFATAAPVGAMKVVGHPIDRMPWSVLMFPVVLANDKRLILSGQLEGGASGSPVLNGAGQVVGIVDRTGSFVQEPLVSAYSIAAIQAMIP